MLTLGAITARQAAWRIPVIGLSAYKGEGFEELIGAIESHRRVAFETELGAERRQAIARFRLEKTAENLLVERFTRGSASVSGPLAERLSARQGDPYTLAAQLLEEALAPRSNEPGASS